ncbi:MAG: hypothetical protein IPG35_09710 [Flavobacteriales bacterium]|nr:hypothetical protein [Flavobacteriales bacterium]
MERPLPAVEMAVQAPAVQAMVQRERPLAPEVVVRGATSQGTFTGGAGATGRVIVTYYDPGVCISGTNGFNSIPDNACGASQFMHAPMPVTGQPTTLGTNPGNARLTSVELIVAHTFNSDLRVSLTTPGGQTRNLILNRFGNGDNLGNPAACPGTVFTLADGGTALVNTNTSNVAGTYQPEDDPVRLHRRPQRGLGAEHLRQCGR